MPGQLMPAGVLVIVPVPLPGNVTVTFTCGAGEKVAVTVVLDAGMAKLQVPVPEHGPLQPANTDPSGTLFT